jgi:hypothetical protein
MMDSFSTQQQVAEGSFSRPSATVCIPVHYRTKKPVLGQWQEKTSADMHDPAYLEEFGNRNIGILCGANNNGLVSIDADTDEGLEELLRLNPAFSETTLTIGARGGNVWFRLLDEEYPNHVNLAPEGLAPQIKISSHLPLPGRMSFYGVARNKSSTPLPKITAYGIVRRTNGFASVCFAMFSERPKGRRLPWRRGPSLH